MKINKILKCASLTVIGVVIMSLLTACNTRDNRAWIENKFAKDLSRVYPTKNIEELSKEFPEGFGVVQIWKTKDFISELKIEKVGNSINGTFEVIYLIGDKEKTIVKSPIEFKNGEILMRNKEISNKYWPIKGFLFEEKTINRNYLSKLTLKDKHYNFQNGAFGITYQINDKDINSFIGKPMNEKAELVLGSSNLKKGAYYNTVAIEYSDDSFYRERVYN